MEQNNIDEDINKKIKKLAFLTKKSEQEILELMKKKKESLGNLINDYGAIIGVANDFHIKREMLEDEKISYIKIKDIILKNLSSATVIGKVRAVFKEKEFTKKDGSTGKVSRIIIGDETSNIVAVLWNDFSEISKEININDPIIISGNIKRDIWQGVERAELHTTTFSTILFGKRLSEHKNYEEILEIIKNIPDIKEKFYTIEEIKNLFTTKKDSKMPVVTIGRISSSIDSTEFTRVDNTKRKRIHFILEDESGKIPTVVWMKAEEEFKFGQGDIIKVKGNCKENINGIMEIHVNDIENIEKSDTKLNLPELKSISTEFLRIENIFEKFKSLDEESRRNFYVSVKGLVTEIDDIKEFESISGTGRVGHFILADETGSIRVTLWNDDVKFIEEIKKKKEKEEDIAISIENTRVKESFTNICELNFGKYSKINFINVNELKNLEDIKSYKTQNKYIIEKKISEISDNDKNIKITGKIYDIDIDQEIVYDACPNCRKKVMQIGNEYYCENCNDTINPIKNLKIKVILKDVSDDSNVECVFFGHNVEKLLNKSADEISNLLQNVGHIAVMEKTRSDLNGKILTLVGNVKFNPKFQKMSFFVNEVKLN